MFKNIIYTYFFLIKSVNKGSYHILQSASAPLDVAALYFQYSFILNYISHFI